jgi:hypothetical protein
MTGQRLAISHIIRNSVATACNCLYDDQMWRWDPDTFGSVAPNRNPSGLGTFIYNLRFPGQYYEVESGLFYNYLRTPLPKCTHEQIDRNLLPVVEAAFAPLNMCLHHRQPLVLCGVLPRCTRGLSEQPLNSRVQTVSSSHV